jgi:TetR/AcrR family transcriptional regulator, fatty acid metabolism regulator protein
MCGVVAEAGDGAVDGRGRHVVRTDSEARRHAGPKPFEHHVGTRAQGARKRRVGGEVADDGLGSGAQGCVPGRGARPHRIPGRWLDADDAGAEPPELSTRIGAGEVASEVDDERVGQRLHAAGGYLYSRPALTDGSIASEDKRKRILDAAIRVFAEHGYHGSRVGDIAEDAGVAHGLLYHYFASKDDVLKTIFVENWGQLLKRFKAVEETDEPAEEKLAGIAKILLRTWRNDPALVTVMVREVARSQHIQGQVVEVGEAFAIIQRVIEEGQAAGSLRSDVDARTASWVIYGGLEEVLTGWVLGQLPDSEDDVTRAEQVAVEVALRGLAV